MVKPGEAAVSRRATDHWIFLGYGEAGATLLPLLRNQGLRTSVFLPAGRTPSKATRRRIRRDSVASVTDTSALGDATAVLSLVSPDSAVSVAQLVAPHLSPQASYVDLNSASGPTARRVEAALSNTRFADGAIMGPVPLLGLGVPIVLSGPGAASFHEAAARYGLRTKVLSGSAGDASSLKMLWSVITKGTIGLLAEALVAAYRLGLTEPLLEFLAAEYGNTGSPAMVLRMLRSSLASGERRVVEMQQAAETLDAVSVPAWTVEATIRWLTALGGVRAQQSPETVIDAVRTIAASVASAPASHRILRDDGPESEHEAVKAPTFTEGVVR